MYSIAGVVAATIAWAGVMQPTLAQVLRSLSELEAVYTPQAQVHRNASAIVAGAVHTAGAGATEEQRCLRHWRYRYGC